MNQYNNTISRFIVFLLVACFVILPITGCGSANQSTNPSSSSASSKSSNSTSESSSNKTNNSDNGSSNKSVDSSDNSSSNSSPSSSSSQETSNSANTLSSAEASKQIMNLNDKARSCYEGAYKEALEGDVTMNHYYEDEIDEILADYYALEVPDDLSSVYGENGIGLYNLKTAIYYLTGVSTGILSNDADLTDYYADLASDSLEDAQVCFNNVTNMLSQ